MTDELGLDEELLFRSGVVEMTWSLLSTDDDDDDSFLWLLGDWFVDEIK